MRVVTLAARLSHNSVLFTLSLLARSILSLPGVSPVNSDAALAALRAGLPRVRFCAVGSRLLLAPSGTGGKLPVEGHLDKGEQ